MPELGTIEDRAHPVLRSVDFERIRQLAYEHVGLDLKEAGAAADPGVRRRK